LADVASLVASVEATGVEVELSVEGTPVPLAAGLDLAAYRILQEALTNVVKHAGPAHVDLRIGWGDDEVMIEVIDDGRGAAARVAVDSGGHGLVGMRERVELYGGRLETGPRPGGGFGVRATLPLAAGVAVS
jgi:signal transduction histidine kinase